MSISYESIGQQCVTMNYVDAVDAGAPCSLSAQGNAKKCAEGDHFIGVAAGCRNGFASVIVRGFVTLKYTGAAPDCGYAKLSANGTGGVKADASGTEYAVFAVDSTQKTVTILL